MRIVGLVGRNCGLAAALCVLLACRGEAAPPQAMAEPIALPDAGTVAEVDRRWPSPLAELSPPELLIPKKGRRFRIYLDAGHGAPGNSGTQSAFCEAEEDFTLRVARHLAEKLRASGRFVVKLSRDGAKRPRYQDRVREANEWNADAFLSLHMDARGYANAWEPSPGKFCWRSDDTPGFAILWSDDAPQKLKQRRLSLAQAIAAQLQTTGFLAYDGVDYTGLYDGDEQPGVFVDRHVPGRRIYVLRRPKVPSVIIETHHALDVRETTRWREPRTLDAFSDAVTAALLSSLSGPSSSPLPSAALPSLPPASSPSGPQASASGQQASPSSRPASSSPRASAVAEKSSSSTTAAATDPRP